MTTETGSGTEADSLCGEGCYEGDAYLSSPGDVAEFDGVSCVKGALIIESSVEATDGLLSLECIDGSLGVSLSGEVLSLAGLAGLRTVFGNVRFAGTGSITTLNGFKSLESISGRLEIFNDGLQSLEGMEKLTSVGDLRIGVLGIDGVPSLQSLNGMPSLGEIKEHLHIYGTHITTLDGLENLAFVGETIAISGNADLPTCVAVDFSKQFDASEVVISGNLPDECGG